MHQYVSTNQLTPADLAFRFTPGRLSLNLVATVGERGHRDIERLLMPADFARWCVKAGLMSETLDVSPEALKSVKTLREAVYRTAQALRCQHVPNPADIETINVWAAQLPVVPQLGLDGRSVSWTAIRSVDAALALVARDAIDLFSSSLVERIKACANSECAMLFLDTSRPGQRRWCAMSGNGCGNRAKKTAFRQRQRNAPVLTQSAQSSKQP